jgi:hypothetical protein
MLNMYFLKPFSLSDKYMPVDSRPLDTFNTVSLEAMF